MTMKNTNILSELYKGLIGVKSWLSRGFVLILALFTLTVGNVWGDNAGLYQCDLTYSYNGVTNTITTSTTSTDLNTPLNATLKITKVKLYFWYFNNDYSKYGNVCGGLMNYNLTGGDCNTEYLMGSEAEWNDDGWVSDSRHKQITITRDLIIASPTSASGNYTFNYCFKGWGDNDDASNCGDIWWLSNGGSNYALNYKIAPPAVSGFGVSTSGYLAGSGTSEDPYLVKSGNSLTFTVSGSKAHSDANSTFNYWLNSGTKKTSGTLSTGSITSTELQSATVHGQYINNSSSSLVGTESTSTIYYKAVSVKDITVYIYVGGCTSDQINSLVLTANPYVGSTALAGVTKYIGDFTTDGAWRKYTFTNVSEVQHVVVARDGGRAVDNITITDDVYYKYDGTELGGKCIARTTPTWNVAPANGAAGGNMTATINNVPDGATVTWSSSATSYATVSSSGYITYVAAGSATISARIQKAASGDYCALDETISQAITVTSGATVSATRTCPEYVSSNSGQVKLDISSTGASTGWYYRVCNSAKTAYYAPDEQSAASNTLSWTMNGSLLTGSNTLVVELYNSARQLVCTSSPVTVNVEIAESVTISAGANGSVSPSGTVYANNNHVHPTITATANTNYHFVNWISNNAAASVANANNATTTVTATASGYTITANFAGDQYTITYKDQGDVTYSGNNEGSLPATHTYGTATALVNGTKAGYTFGGWYTDASCTSSAGSSIGATAKTSNFTLYAKWTERMSTLSTANSYNAGNPGYASPTVSGSATNVGYVTTREISATAAGTGYTFAGWTLTNCTRTDGGAPTATSITIRSNGDGAAASVVANYEEDRSSRWHLVGLNETGYEIFPDGWNVSNTSMMQKASGHSAESVVYATVTISSKRTYLFKIVDDNGASDDIWYGYSTGSTYLEWTETSTKNVYSGDGNGNNLKFTPSLLGTYEFKVDYSGTYPAVTITYPEVYAVSGSFNSWTETSNLAFTGNDGSYSVAIDGNSTNYEFKVLDNGSWYGHTNKTFTGTESNVTLATPSNNIKLKADVYPSGSYTFAYNKSTKKFGVTYPASYVINYAVGATKGQSTAPWANFTGEIGDKDIASGTKIASGTTIHLYAANAKEHYTFYGWYTEENPARDDYSKRVSTSQHYFTSVTETKSYYAIYFEDPYWVNTYAEGFGSIDPTAGQNAYIVTPSGNFTATPNIGYKFDSWEQRSGALTITSPSAATTTVKATAASVLQANFSPRWSVLGTPNDPFGGWSAYNTNLFTGYTKVSTKDVGYKTVTLAANTTYEIKVYDRQESTFYGGSATQDIHYANGGTEYTVATTSSPQSVFIHSAAAGTYTLNWNLTDKKIAVVYPTSLFITSGQKTEGQDDNVGGSFTAVDNSSNDVKGGKFVADGASVTFTAATNTGYNFSGWFDNDGCTTGQYTAGTNVSIAGNAMTLSSIDDDKTVYAKFVPKTYTITLTRTGTGYGSGGDASVTATYNQTMPVATMPTAAAGYAFMGYYSETGGNGRRFIDPSGNWVAAAGDTISGGNWVHADNATLYAYFKKAVITALTFDNPIVAPGTEVGVTATIAPAVTEGTKVLCWRVLYNNGNPLDPQPGLTKPSTNKITFNAPTAPGTYKVEAKLHLDDCDGTLLSEQVMNFQVAGDHTVTVEYKCGDEEIASSTSVNGKPLEWTEITAPEDPFGYIFSKWKAGDGITINGAVDGEKTDRTIQFKAVYDGKLTVVYTKKDFIYFKNTLGWSGDDIHVYFYNSSGYWDDSNGAGATGPNCIGKGKMTLVPGETDIYYWDYGAGITGGAAAATTHVAFTNINKTNQENFYECDVVYPTKGNNEGFSTGTPMFVPISQEKVTKNTKAYYYNKGYWTKYSGGTGYSVDIFFSKGGSYDKSVSFEEGDTPGMPFTTTVYLTGGTTLGFKVHRSSGLYYYAGTDVTMANASTAKSLTYDNTSKKQTGITTNVTGEYIFTLTCATDGLLNVTVKYPASAGDYRLVYSDGVQTKPLISDVVPKVNKGKDTVSFFVRPGRTPVLKIQQATESAGTLSWSAGTNITSSLSSLTKDSVYNICLTMDGSGNISVENVEAYTGNFYIRTDAANNKWDNYRSADHVMTYSEYSEKNSDFTHYWMKFVGNNTNVKFVVANDYSPCISDTLIQQTYRGGDKDHVNGSGNLAHEANIRFMWHRHTNEIYRAYLSPAKENGSHYLVLRGTANNLLSESGTPLTSGNNNGVEDHSIQFIDDENWIYETTVQSVPGSFVKLYAKYNNAYFYFKGENNNTWDASNAIQLVTGSGSAVKVRVIYDFKTDRLVAAYLPSGEISDQKAINADVMFIREHQGDIEQLTFSEKDSKMGSITDIKTAYAVMRFNKWTLNNKSTADGHAPLPAPLSRYERDIFYVSFPFDVNLNEVFGFGTYGIHWIMEYYDGASRAVNGFWKDTPTYWRFITNRNGVVLKKNQGYILALDLDMLGETSDVWRNDNERAELFFPSSGNLPDITAGTVTAELEAHTCTINRNTPQGDRRIADSHWNIMGVPTYVNTSNVDFANTEWQTTPRDPATGHFGGPNFLYTWNSADNSLTPTSATGFTYHAMHAYTVQYYGNVSWTASVNPSSIVARQRHVPNAYEWCLELQQNEQMTDRTYVRMSNEEEVTTGFEFGYDMSKSMEWAKANIYTFIGSEAVAGNSMPLETVQTTVVPVGVYIKSDGEYTFSMPEGTNGVGITLIDTEANVRTSLSALDYTVTLSAGEYTNRFFLEISPVQNTPTDIENGGLMNGENGVRKVMIDGILYIVRDGKMYDARGARVE